MNWQERPLEKHLQWFLTERLGGDGENLWVRYQATRNEIIDHVLSHIAKTEPNLTDHSATHIADVIDNASLLLGFKNEHHVGDINRDLNIFLPHEMLCLLLGLCLHDIGNLLGREEHQNQIAQVWGTLASWKMWTVQERNLIISLCRAHSSGKSHPFDTLKPLTLAAGYFHKQQVHLSAIAALIRFADELAEGAHRTSQTILDLGIVADTSKLYHHYALCTDVAIDKANGRVALTYVVDLANPNYPTKKRELNKFLKDLLHLIYSRALKLNRERQLARYYAPCLVDIRETSVSLKFQKGGCELGLPLEPLVFNELESTSVDVELFERIDSRYKIIDLIREILGKNDNAKSI